MAIEFGASTGNSSAFALCTYTPTREYPHHPFNLCIANATLFFHRVGTWWGKGWARRRGRNCYFNEISLNGSCKGEKGTTTTQPFSASRSASSFLQHISATLWQAVREGGVRGARLRGNGPRDERIPSYGMRASPV